MPLALTETSGQIRRVIGARVRYFRMKAHLTQKALASDLGIALVTWARYETGQTAPPCEIIVQLVNRFHCTAGQLLGTEAVEVEGLPCIP